MYIEDRIKGLEKIITQLNDKDNLEKRVYILEEKLKIIKADFEEDVLTILKRLERKKRIYRVIRNEGKKL